MKRVLLFLISSLACFAQAATLTPANTTTPPAGGYPSGAVIPISIAKTGNPTATGLQFDIQTSAGVSSVVMSIPAGLAVTKQLSCAPFSSNFRCLIVGFNTSVIPDGVIATATVTLASSINTSPVNVTVANPVETDATGTALAVTVANPTVSLPTRNPCDVTGDGSVSPLDLSAVVNPATLRASTPDLNSDGTANVQDAQIVATAGTGPAFVCNAH